MTAAASSQSVTPQLQTLFQSIATVPDEAVLQGSVMAGLGDYFNASRSRLFFAADFLIGPEMAREIVSNTFPAGSISAKLMQRAISIEYNPVLRYLVQRHAVVHDETVLPPGVWRSLCPRADHAHVMTGPVIYEGQLIGGVAFTRDRTRGPFNSENLADLSALCIHISSRIARLRTQPSAQATPKAQLLTPREQEIADLVAEGLTNKAIGDRLWITENSVKQALKRMYRKFEVGTRAEMVAMLMGRR